MSNAAKNFDILATSFERST